MSRRTRVLVIDDSAFARKVVRQVVGAAADLEVAGYARDGLGVLRALAGRPDAPRVVVVSSSASDSDLAIEALQMGAVAVVHKPTAIATDRLYDVADDLLAAVRVAASSRAHIVVAPQAVEGIPGRISVVGGTQVIVIGTSTGGPQALTHLATRFPADLPVPVAAVVHIPVGYTTSLAARLDGASPLSVREAEEGLEVTAGMMVIARAGVHLHLDRTDRGAVCRLRMEPHGALHRPSVDALFRSAAKSFGSGVLAAICTGMGDDGLAGARAIRASGGRVLAESAISCVVDGMPRVVREAGLAEHDAPIEAMAAALVARL